MVAKTLYRLRGGWESLLLIVRVPYVTQEMATPDTVDMDSSIRGLPRRFGRKISET